MKLLFLILFFLISSTVSLNFLVFCPLYAHSHHKFLAKIADTLTDAGHNVTFLAPIIIRKYQDVKYLESTKDIIYVEPDAELEALGFTHDYSNFWIEDASFFGMVPAVRRFNKMFHKIYENFGKDLTLLDELKGRNYDALIFELLCTSAFPIGEYLGVKAMLPTLSMTHHTIWSRYIGEPSSPSVLPSMISAHGNDMTFKERLMSTLGDLFFGHFVHPGDMYSYNYPHNYIDLEEAAVRAPFVFLNSNPYLDFPRPLLSKSILIGGISINTTEMRAEHLEEHYDTILKERKSTILISFGSMIFSKDMPMSYKETIIKVIESLPDVTFIWKYESEDVKFAKNLKNLHFSKWVPQTALLADPRLSAFITHGGLGSVTELSYMGKPAILVPVFADQVRNSKMLSQHGGSIFLNKRDLGKFETLRNAVEAILNDESYKQNAAILGRQLEEQPVSPHELLVKHAEFGAKFGELPALDPYSRKMSFFTFYMLDIILFLTTVIGGILLTFGFLIRWVFRKVVRPKVKTQ